jgi:glyoxylase-like metal-dependent hydrolase (beta-lactamase superfamily II)
MRRANPSTPHITVIMPAIRSKEMDQFGAIFTNPRRVQDHHRHPTPSGDAARCVSDSSLAGQCYTALLTQFSPHELHPGGGTLFDTGQGNALPRNDIRMGVEWERVTSIVLSHGHYDHTG